MFTIRTMPHDSTHIRRVGWTGCFPREHWGVRGSAGPEKAQLKTPEIVRENMCYHTPGFSRARMGAPPWVRGRTGARARGRAGTRAGARDYVLGFTRLSS